MSRIDLEAEVRVSARSAGAGNVRNGGGETVAHMGIKEEKGDDCNDVSLVLPKGGEPN